MVVSRFGRPGGAVLPPEPPQQRDGSGDAVYFSVKVSLLPMIAAPSAFW